MLPRGYRPFDRPDATPLSRVKRESINLATHTLKALALNRIEVLKGKDLAVRIGYQKESGTQHTFINVAKAALTDDSGGNKLDVVIDRCRLGNCCWLENRCRFGTRILRNCFGGTGQTRLFSASNLTHLAHSVAAPDNCRKDHSPSDTQSLLAPPRKAAPLDKCNHPACKVAPAGTSVVVIRLPSSTPEAD